MFSAVFAAALLFAEAAPAAAPADPSVAAAPMTPTAAKGPKVNKDGLICHNEEVLGTRFPKKVCVTPAQQEQMAKDGKDQVNQMQALSHGFNH